MTDLVITTQTELLEVPDVQQEVVDTTEAPVVLDVAVQGPPGPAGPAGPPGPIGNADGAFLVSNRFNEISTNEIAKAQARQNLGVHTVDGGTFN